jgi:CheY-like chemotaxis protein
MLLPTILQVDDEPSDAFLLQSVFSEAGIANPVQVAADGQQAIDYLAGIGAYSDRERFPLPCLVLLDLKLPKKSGLAVIEWIRAQPALRPIVVIVFSSSALPSDVRTAYALGANSFIEKPVAYENALAMARLLKGWWLDLNQFPPA